jgi:hypothetical protein
MGEEIYIPLAPSGERAGVRGIIFSFDIFRLVYNESP